MAFKLRFKSKIPSALRGGPGIAIVKDGLVYTAGLDYTGLGVISTYDPSQKMIVVEDKTSGQFNTVLLSSSIAAGYGGTSSTSTVVGTGTKTFTVQSGLAYVAGSRVRVTSSANVANFMEGLVTSYTGTSLTINATVSGGSGTFADWVLSIAGTPGAGSGDMLSTNNLSDLANKATALGNLLFLATGTGGVLRSATSKLSDAIYADDFGADKTGVADSTSAINAALAAYDVVFLSAGTYKITGAILMNRGANSYLIGQGEGATKVQSTANNANAISVGSLGTSPANWGISGLTIDRTVTALSGGNGIFAPNLTNRAIIERVLVQNCYNGLYLGPAAYGRVRQIISTNNQNCGLYGTNSAASGGWQWQIDSALLQANGAQGLIVIAGVAGPSGITVGSWNNIATFGNSSYGIAAIGTSTIPIFNIRANGMFLGGDGNSEIYLDTFSDPTGCHVFNNVSIELPGGNGTGPGLATPASNLGDGIFISANNSSVQINGGFINQAALNGIQTAGTAVQISNIAIYNSGRVNTAAQRIGVVVRSGGSASIIGCKIYNTVGGTGQQVGVQLDSGSSKNYVALNDLSSFGGNAVSNLANNSTTTDNVIVNNKGYQLTSHAVTVGASPFTYRAGPTPEAVYLFSGTVSSIAIDGLTVSAGLTNTTIPLQPNQTVTVTYTSTPAMTAVNG